MTDDERIDKATDHALAARKELSQADMNPDPVFRRRAFVTAAEHFRKAADLLDDEQHLTL